MRCLFGGRGGGVAPAGSSGIGAEGRGLQTLILFNKKIVSCRIRPYYFITLIVSRFVLHTELSHFLKLTSRVKIFWEKSCWHHKCRLFIANIHLFQRFPIKEDTLFATLNGEIVYPVSLRLKEPENHTLFSGTYPLRPNNGVHSPSGYNYRSIFVYSALFIKRIVRMVMIVVVTFSWPKTQTVINCNKL